MWLRILVKLTNCWHFCILVRLHTKLLLLGSNALAILYYIDKIMILNLQYYLVPCIKIDCQSLNNISKYEMMKYYKTFWAFAKALVQLIDWPCFCPFFILIDGLHIKAPLIAFGSAFYVLNVIIILAITK